MQLAIVLVELLFLLLYAFMKYLPRTVGHFFSQANRQKSAFRIAIINVISLKPFPQKDRRPAFVVIIDLLLFFFISFQAGSDKKLITNQPDDSISFLQLFSKSDQNIVEVENSFIQLYVMLSCSSHISPRCLTKGLTVAQALKLYLKPLNGGTYQLSRCQGTYFTSVEPCISRIEKSKNLFYYCSLALLSTLLKEVG